MEGFELFEQFVLVQLVLRPKQTRGVQERTGYQGANAAARDAAQARNLNFLRVSFRKHWRLSLDPEVEKTYVEVARV